MPNTKNQIKKTLLSILTSASLALTTIPSASAQKTPLPNLGDTLEISPRQERKIGDEIARQLYRDTDYLPDAPLEEYTEEIWQNLITGAKKQGEITPEINENFAWKIFLGKDPSINAFALAGGYFGLHAGLIASVETTEELASVLAHEMAHSTQRHIPRMIDRQKRQTPLILATMILGAMAASKNPNAANAILVGGQAAAIQGQLNYSREMEREADRIGLGILKAAGYQESGFTNMFEKLQKAARLNDSGQYPYLRSHPLTVERIADMQQRTNTSANNQKTIDITAQLMAGRAQILSKPDIDNLRQSAAYLENQKANTPHNYKQTYAAALAYQKMKNPEKAEQAANQLIAQIKKDSIKIAVGHAPYYAHLLAAEIHLENKKPAKAKEHLEKAQKTKTGRAQKLLLAQAQIDQNKIQEAINLLQNWLDENPQDAKAWQTLAIAQEKAGQYLKSTRAAAEAAGAQMDWQGAINRLKAAQDFARKNQTKQADLIEAEIIQSRLKTMLEKQKEIEEKD